MAILRNYLPEMFSYWGKAQNGWHLLPYHSLDVAASAQVLLSVRPALSSKLVTLTGLDEDELQRWIGFFAAIHDLGKFSSAFQGLAPAVREALGHADEPPAYNVRHDSLGWALWCSEISKGLAGDRRIRRALDVWARCCTGHHGQPPSLAFNARRVRVANYFTQEDTDTAAQWVREVDRLFTPDLTQGAESDFERASWWLAGLITLADWVGSNACWFPYRRTPMRLDDYWNQTQLRAERAIREAGLDYSPPRHRSFSALFPEYTPTPLQAAVDKLPIDAPSLILIEDLTGSGKTEAALVAAGDHFFFGLPTMATANGLWQRVAANKILTGQKILAHSARWLMPSAMTNASAWLNDSTRRALLSQMGVGTIDQAVLAVLYVRHGALRILGLADKTLIVDEVHACDEYQRAVLKILIELQARVGATVILLSATCPQLHRQEYAAAWARGRGIKTSVLQATAYPLITQVHDAAPTEQAVSASYSRRVEVVEESDFGTIIQRITAAAQSGQCVCWIRNTVKDAIEAYDMMAAQGVATDLFHARFTTGDRAEIEQRVLARFGKGSKPAERHDQVLIATQVVEQSLDLDFDLIVSDLAPVDLLIQRAGRLHRHNRGDRGIPTMVLHVPAWTDSPSVNWVSDWNGGTAIVYPDHGRLWLTMKIIRERNGIHVPQDARLLLESVYGAGIEQNIPEPLAAITIKQMGEGLARAAMSGYHAISPNGAYESDGTTRWQEERAPTRLGDPTAEWVLTSDGQPLNGSVPESTVRLRLASLINADTDPRIEAQPWQRVMSLRPTGTAWSASGDRGKGRPVNIQYDQLRGLIIT